MAGDGTNQQSAALGVRARDVEQGMRDLGYVIRKPLSVSGAVAEIDVAADAGEMSDLRAHLEPLSFVGFRPIRQRKHQFFISHDDNGWLKVDVKLGQKQGSAGGDILWALGGRRGLVVALLGADGSGKSTLAASLSNHLPFDVQTRYLGVAAASHTVDRRSVADTPTRPSYRSYLGVIKWMVKSSGRVAAVTYQARRGTVVVCDRHPIEAGRVSDEPAIVKAIKRWFARRVLPTPDLVIVLAAPGVLLHDRKGEHTPERLDQMTEAWKRAAASHVSVIIDASQTPDAVELQVSQHIWALLAPRRAS